MRLISKILVIGILVLSIFTYERYFLTKWYEFTLDGNEIEVMSDACETCYLDDPIDHTISIKTKYGLYGKFKLYTEGPRMEFGLNSQGTELLVHCPGFSSLFINLKKMKEIEISDKMRNLKLDEYTIHWVIRRNKKIIQLDSVKLPDRNWEGN
jgi:hypothetical protein